MYKNYAPEGLVAISVSLDELNEDKDGVRAKVLKFLRLQNAAFTNFILDEPPEVWQKRLNFEGPPCVFVFDQQGKLRKQFKDEFTYQDVEKLVKELLGKS